jgi:hypothetical protein
MLQTTSADSDYNGDENENILRDALLEAEPITILSDGTVALGLRNNIKIFDMADTRYQSDCNKDADHLLSIPVPKDSNVTQLVTLSDGRLLATLDDGSVRIWR